MKTPSNELFQLIRSLQPQEKAYFKQYMSSFDRGKKLTSCLFLFDRLNKMKVYEEKNIKSEMAKKFHTTNFPKLKNTLSSVLLTSLVEYHSQSSITLQLNQMLSEVEILMSKNLLSKAASIIKKAKMIASKTEELDHLQMLLGFEQNIHSITNYPKSRIKKRDITKEKIELLEKERNLFMHQKNREEIYAFYIKNAEISRPDDIQMISNALRKADLLPPPMTFKAEKQLLNSKALAHYFLNNKTERYKFSKKFVEIYDNKGEDAILDDLRNYLIGLSYLLFSQNLLMKFKEVEETYEKAKYYYTKLSPKRRSAKIETALFALDINYIESLLKQLQYTKVIDIGETISKKYLKYNWVEPYGLIYLYYYVALSYFYSENNKLSLKWINRLFIFEGSDENKLIIISKILQIIIHYELQNNDLVFSLAQSLIKKLNKVNKLGLFEKSFLNFCINKLSKIKGAEEKKEAFIAYRSQLKSSPQELLNEKSAYSFFDFDAWIDFKIENRPFFDILSERSVKRK